MNERKKEKSGIGAAIDQNRSLANMALQNQTMAGRTTTTQEPIPRLLQLPAEIQTMIWAYVIADFKPYIGMDKVHRFASTGTCHVESNHDPQGRYPPHPLCYISKNISAGFAAQIYQNVVFRIKPDFCRREFKLPIPIKRLSLNLKGINQWLRFTVSFFDIEITNSTGQVLVHNLPSLKHLEIIQHVDCLVGIPKRHRRYEYVKPLARLLFYPKSFEAVVKISCPNHSHGTVVCHASPNGTFKLSGHVKDIECQNTCTRRMLEAIDCAYVRHQEAGKGEYA